MFPEKAVGGKRERGQEYHIGHWRYCLALDGHLQALRHAVAADVALFFFPGHHAMTIYASAHVLI